MTKTKTYEIRTLQVADLGGIARMLQDMHKEESGFYPEFNESYLAGSLLQTSLDKNGKVFVAAGKNDIAAILSVECFWFDWNPSVNFLRNGILAVAKDYRKTAVSDALIQKAREFAAEKGMVLYINIMSDDRAEIKDRLLKTKGGTYLGGNFMFKPET